MLIVRFVGLTIDVHVQDYLFVIDMQEFARENLVVDSNFPTMVPQNSFDDFYVFCIDIISLGLDRVLRLSVVFLAGSQIRSLEVFRFVSDGLR